MNGSLHGTRARSALRRVTLAAVALVPLAFAGAAWAKTPGWLGVSMQELTPALRDGMNVKGANGVLIGDVSDDSPADKAGLREGDIIVRANGEKVTTPADLQRIVREAGAGASVSLHVLRDGSERDVAATLGERPAGNDDAPQAMMHRRMMGDGKAGTPPLRIFRDGASAGGFLGVQLAELTPQLRDYFGVGDGEGVLISQVEKDSPAAAAGLRAGDVITKIGDASVGSSTEARSEIRDHKPGSSVSLTVVREKTVRTMSATLDKAPPSDVSMGDIPGFEGLKGLEGLKGFEGLTSPDGNREIRIKRLSPGEAPHVYEWHGGDDSEGDDSDSDNDSDSDGPRIFRFDGKDGTPHRIIIRDKKVERGNDGDAIWGGEGDDGDKDMRVIIKKRHGSRDAREDRDLRREIRDLERQIDELKDQIGDGEDDDR